MVKHSIMICCCFTVNGKGVMEGNMFSCVKNVPEGYGGDFQPKKLNLMFQQNDDPSHAVRITEKGESACMALAPSMHLKQLFS